MDGRVGIVQPGLGVEREAQGHSDSVAHEVCRRGHPVRGQAVQRSTLVVLAPATPHAEIAKQSRELLGTHMWIGGWPVVHVARPDSSTAGRDVRTAATLRADGSSQ